MCPVGWSAPMGAALQHATVRETADDLARVFKCRAGAGILGMCNK